MPYLWTDQETIQAFLDADGTIQIGTGEDNFASNTAETFENQSVFEVKTMLSIGWNSVNSLTQSNIPADIARLVAQLTASRIATIRIGTTGGTVPQWVKSYRNEVFAQLQRMLVNHKTETVFEGILTPKEISLTDILLLIKSREQSVTQDV